MCYWVLRETEYLIMGCHVVTIRNYMIMSLVLSDPPSPKDCCWTSPFNHHKMEVVHLGWSLSRTRRHEQDAGADSSEPHGTQHCYNSTPSSDHI